MVHFLLASILMMASATPAFAAVTKIQTFKGDVAISDIAQIMANRYEKPVVITRAQIKSKMKKGTKAGRQSFVFSAIIGGPDGKHDAKCAFVRTMKGDGIACRAKSAKFQTIRINWKRDTLS